MKHFAPDIASENEKEYFWYLDEGVKAFFARSFEPGEEFSYSQMFLAEHVIGVANQFGIHVTQGNRPGVLKVVRYHDRLPTGSWCVNVNHLGQYCPTFGRVVEEIGPMVKVQLYNREGKKLQVEPLEKHYMVRIEPPRFPLGGPAWVYRDDKKIGSGSASHRLIRYKTKEEMSEWCIDQPFFMQVQGLKPEEW